MLIGRLALAICGCILVTVSACNANNEYYARMKGLAENVRGDPGDDESWNQLVAYATSSDRWNREYAHQFLMSLIGDPSINDARKKQLIHLFREGLSAQDHSIRRHCADAIQRIGSEAVNESAKDLIKIVMEGKNDDVSWFSAQALGNIGGGPVAEKAFSALLATIGDPPPPETPKGAPQLRRYALDAAQKIAINGYVKDPVERLKKLLNEEDSVFASRIKESIKEIRKSNENGAGK